MSSGPMQCAVAKPRQIGNEATVCGWHVCRSKPELF